ncbi:glycosyltransferase family 2 protein [Alistipes provencensis]|uniref:glycosyltransferase family 2 protein n=1 Tax=Alistipes provencensis TaxID=1816676 RepID=UPI0007ECCA0E|nr:glycosyltransferase family 2 protein [Alistipes provencensis]
MEPKISVIIPVYNVEPFLARCLDSVVGQTLRDIEIICVDDGSPDRSIDILNRYAAGDARIRVISQENRGLGGARNRGFDAAAGEFILFVDSDDWIDAAYCERLYEAAREAGADVACASMLKIRPSYSKWTIRYTERQVVADAQEKFRICRCPPDFYVMNKLLRREMLLRLGLRFRERVCYEDVEYTMRVLCEGGNVVTVPDVVYRYVVNATSITKSRQTPKKQQDKYLAHKAFADYMAAHGLHLDARFRHITRRTYDRWGITWLKLKECGDRQTFRLFDLIPIWWRRAADK